MLTHSLPHLHGAAHTLPDVQRVLGADIPFRAAAALFHSLADDTRLKLFWLLCHREECVVNLSALLAVTSPAVSHHLRCLKELSLVESRRIGKEVHYRAAQTPVCHALHRMVEQTMSLACPQEQNPSTQALMPRIHQYILEHLHEKHTIAQLAQAFHISPTTLKSHFQQAYGMPLAAHMKKHRLERAAQLLAETDKSIAEIAVLVGYGSQSRLAEAFRQAYGCLPSLWRKGNKK